MLRVYGLCSVVGFLLYITQCKRGRMLRSEDDIYKAVERLVQIQYGKETVIEIGQMKRNHDGFNNDIVFLHLNFSCKAGLFSQYLVLKNFSNGSSNVDSDIKYKKELAILSNHAINSSINVPTVFFHDAESRWVLMEKVEGITLDKWLLSNTDKMTQMFKQFGESLAKIHSVKLDSIINYVTEAESSQNNINTHLEQLRNRITQYKEPKYLPILDNIAKRFKAVSFNRDVLNHGDYHFRNVLISNERELFILDWEKASIRDYRFDIANTIVLGYSWFAINFKDTMLDGYQRVTQKKVDNLDCFLALLSFDSFTKAIPLLQGADDSHIRDRSFEWLKRRYELFVKYNETRIQEAEDYLNLKGVVFSI